MSKVFKDLYFGIQSITGKNGLKGLSWRTKLTLLIPRFVWDIYDSVYNFVVWVSKSVSYAMYLRKDRDWNSGDILSLLHFKLTRVRKHLVNGSLADEEIKKQSDLIDTMLGLIERINGNEYRKELDQAFENKYGKIVSRCQKEIGPDGIEHNYFKLRYENTNTEEEIEQASKDLYDVGVKQEEARNKDWKKLGDLIGSGVIDNLWD